MLPDMSDVLTEWEQPVILKAVSTTTVDFEPVTTVTESDILAVVQVAKAEDLKVLQIDWSLRYITCHSKKLMSIGQYIEYQGLNYKIITPSKWTDYGYSEVIAEEVKGAIV